MLNIDRNTLIIKITEFKEGSSINTICLEAKSQSLEVASTPESTFSMECKTEDEIAARNKAELPYFVGQHDEGVDKSKLFEVDDADRHEAFVIIIYSHFSLGWWNQRNGYWRWRWRVLNLKFQQLKISQIH